MGQIRNSYKIFVANCEEKEPLGSPSHGRDDNIRRDLREMGWKSVDWIHLIQDRDQW
jgi:hypothetical protein